MRLDRTIEKTRRPDRAEADRIRVDDIREPVLTRAQAIVKRAASRKHVYLTVGEVLERARRRTGLDDFGSADFEERLALLIGDYEADEGLSGLGKQMVGGDLVRYASNRLLIQDTWTRHPEILQEPIEQPLIVAGLPRSGTTHLVNLLAADSRFRSLPLWESQEPVPNPRERAPSATSKAAMAALDRALPRRARSWLGVASLQADPRYLRSLGKWVGMRVMAPYIAAMHPMNPDHVHEELELMAPDFASYTFEWTGNVPSFRDHYFATDQTPHYRYMKRVMQLLQWRDEGPCKPWVMKCPQHLEQLPALLEVFPDATVVFTHRDPVAVVQSTVTMLGYSQRMSRKRPDPDGLIAYWAERIERLLRAGVEDRSLVSADRSYDVLFHEFMGDTERTVDAVYAAAGMPRTEGSREEQRRFLEAHPRGKGGLMSYDLVGQFGVEPERLRTRYQFYFDRFDVRAE